VVLVVVLKSASPPQLWHCNQALAIIWFKFNILKTDISESGSVPILGKKRGEVYLTGSIWQR